MLRKLGSLLTVISSILTAFGALSPTVTDSLIWGFGISAAKQLRFEIISLLVLGILLLVMPSSSWKKLFRRLGQFLQDEVIGTVRCVRWLPKTKDQLIAVIITALVILLPIACAKPLINEFRLVARARVYLMKELLRPSYRRELLRVALRNESAARYDAALSFYRRIITAFPGHRSNWYIEWKMKEVENRLACSKYFGKRALEREKKRGLDRQSFFLLAESLRLDPTNEYIQKELESRIKRIDEGRDVPTAFHHACATKDDSAAAALYRDWGWYLFEDEVESLLFTGSFGRPLSFSIGGVWDLIRLVSPQEFDNAVEASWELAPAKRILDISKKETLSAGQR